MMKNKVWYLLLSLLLLVAVGLTGASAVQAQEDYDTILARAAAKGFLVTLTRADLADTMNFYLLDSVKQSDILAELPETTAFEITAADWVSDVSYQIKAVLQPGEQEIAVYTGKYNGRWRVEGIDLPAVGAAVTAEESAPATGSAVNAAPVVSGNGSGTLVFQTQSGSDIYVVNADGTGLRRLTHGLDPQLSPNGTQVAFTRWEPRYELFTINIDGSNERAWASNWRQMKSPTWTADSTSLVFSWQNGGRLEGDKKRIDLLEAALDGDTPRIHPDAIGFERTQGKDGRPYLIYYIPADAHWSLKQVNLQTGQLTDLATEMHSYGPTGHPTEAQQLIYRGDNGVALHNLAAQTDQPITGDARDHTPVVSPDGSKIAVSYWQDDHWEIHTMNIDGFNRQRLTSTPITVLAENRQLTSEFVAGKERFVAGETAAWNNAAPAWSPDGSRIAFITDRAGQWQIWVMNADGSDQQPMFANGALDGLALNYAGVDERMLSWR